MFRNRGFKMKVDLSGYGLPPFEIKVETRTLAAAAATAALVATYFTFRTLYGV